MIILIMLTVITKRAISIISSDYVNNEDVNEGVYIIVTTI